MLASWKKSYDQPRQNVKKQRQLVCQQKSFWSNFGFAVVLYGCESWTIKKAEH